MPRQAMSTGITSRRLRSFDGSCRKYVPRRYERGAEVLIPSFHPRKGWSIEVCTIDGRTTALGSPAPRVVSSDSAKLLVKVYVLGQPSLRARRVPARVRRLRIHRRRFFRINSPTSG